jgi:hypothetical protein
MKEMSMTSFNCHPLLGKLSDFLSHDVTYCILLESKFSFLSIVFLLFPTGGVQEVALSKFIDGIRSYKTKQVKSIAASI